MSVGGVNMPHQQGTKPVAQNRRAYHDYFVEEKVECGLVLSGTEIKSIRAGKVSIKESWAQIRDREAWVEGMHISPYEQGSIFNSDPLRRKKLLLHKKEIMKLEQATMRQGFTLIPLEIYLRDGRAKLLLGLCKGKHLHDKRESEAKKTIDREINRAVKTRQR